MSTIQRFALACICLTGFITCFHDNQTALAQRATTNTSHAYFPIEEGAVKITGQIKNYKGIFKTGRLSILDAVSRQSNDLIFAIDEDGRFATDFLLLHAVSAQFDLEGDYYSVFIEPENEYQVELTGEQVTVRGKNGNLNRQLQNVRAALEKQFVRQNQSASRLYEQQLAPKRFQQFHDELAETKLNFLDQYCGDHRIDGKVKRILENEITFFRAHAWVCFLRFDFSAGKQKLKSELPNDVISRILAACPIQSHDAWTVRIYSDFISNVSDIMRRSGSLDDEFTFYESSGVFEDKELVLVKGAYQGDQAILKSDAFSKFNTTANMLKANRLRARYRVSTLLKHAAQLPTGIGRDLIIAQGVSKTFFGGVSVVPHESEWRQIENLIGNQEIMDHLASIPATVSRAKAVHSQSRENSGNTSWESVRKKYIDRHKGKVIYIDFWSTWCGPCRGELPHAERLQQELANSDTVFLNLCAKSEQEDWRRLIKQKEISGQNFLLDDSEYHELAKQYEINGFPTYVLLDRNGKVVSKNAPRPSSLKEVKALINNALKR